MNVFKINRLHIYIMTELNTSGILSFTGDTIPSEGYITVGKLSNTYFNPVPVAYRYTSTKEYINEFPVAYKQWKADTHCSLNHGYALSFKFYFGTNYLDKRGWVVDYGGLKELKEVLKSQFDHTTLIAADDPDLPTYRELDKNHKLKLIVLPGMGCECIADLLYKYVNSVYIPDSFGPGEAERVWCYRVEVRETPSNMAFREGHRMWGEDLSVDF